MKTLPISRYRFFQKLQPLTLLKKITSKSNTGCLQVFGASGAWSFYLDEGRLIYACYSEKMFEPLYRNLQRLSQQVSTIPSGINEQLQLIFENGIENKSIPNPDYLAICWLVNQKYISHIQAALLVEQLALEVLESFLKLQDGSYEFIPESFLDDLPKFCYLNLRTLVEQCQSGVKATPHQYQQFWQQPPQPQSQPQAANQKQSVHQVNNVGSTQADSQFSPRKPYRIFCIDNDAVVLQTVKNFLDENIFTFTGMTDSVNALMEIISIKPDLIILSATMPNLDGYEICSLLRKHTYFKNTPVILTIASRRLRDRVKIRMVKASGYLVKPFSQGDLMKTIFQHIV
ncbi:MAG TPA: response regulator [Nostocaceae cyanobacterium]|nr:response regulator [Nostocaceae cyanobacterium]